MAASELVKSFSVRKCFGVIATLPLFAKTAVPYTLRSHCESDYQSGYVFGLGSSATSRIFGRDISTEVNWRKVRIFLVTEIPKYKSPRPFENMNHV